MSGKEARFEAALQWIRDVSPERPLDAGRRRVLVESAKAIVRADELFVGPPAQAPRRRGRWFRAGVGLDAIVAALPRDAFSDWEKEFLLHAGEVLSRADREATRSLAERLAAVEREAILEALRSTGGKKAPAARILGVTRAGLYLMIRRHRIA